MAFDRNPRGNAADIFVAGKTTEQVIRAIADGTAPDGTLAALVARFDRKAASRDNRALLAAPVA